MTDEIKHEAVTDDVPVYPEGEVAPPAEEEKDGKKKLRRLEAEVEDLKKKLEEAAAALAAANDQHLRLAAEYENFRKRSAKERELLFSESLSDALSAFLPVIDNLERAAQFTDGESVAKGVSMTLNAVSETLQKLGVTEIEAEGKPFDPEVHYAVFHVEDESLGENVVAEVVQKGYRKGDRILRYAMVKVAN